MHPWEEITDEITRWLRDEPLVIAEAFLYRGRAPWSARASEAQKLDFYRAHMENPDGTPNAQGRAQILERVGIEGYYQIVAALSKEEREGSIEESVEMEAEYDDEQAAEYDDEQAALAEGEAEVIAV